MKIVATHSGGFHADDVFAVAAFQLLLGEENMQVLRTRDEVVLATADYVVDVGGVYDDAHNRFDHHQPGAPVRDNGIPYAGFGLMWKHFGAEICQSETIAGVIEEKLCLPIDAGDNGVSLYSRNEYDIAPAELYQIVSSYAPVWGSEASKDEAFLKAVDFARGLLERTIQQAFAQQKQEELIAEVYAQATDKRILVFEVSVSAVNLVNYEDVEMVVCPDDPTGNDNWKATCVRKNFNTIKSRVSFPETWAGLLNADLAKVSKISDAVFCHKARFVFVAGSKESVLKAANLAA